MAVKSNINQYRGVNPHLQSILQTPSTPDSPGMFSSFHSHHVVHIADFLNTHLPRQYVARAEQSLQIFSQSSLGAFVHSQPRKPDVSVYRRPESAGRVAATASTPASTWTWEAVVIDTVEIVPEDQMMAVVIHRLEEHQRLGVPVTQLEVLSPANKPGGRHSETYRKKRLQLLESGLPLVEIDYLHEQVSPLIGLPAYPHDPGSYAYYIAISDPHPSIIEGRVKVSGFNVDAPIPAIPVPLDGENYIAFNFDEVYQYTFERSRWGDHVDYAAEPARLDTYSEADREPIRARMAAIKAAHESGADLDAGPVVIEDSQS